MATDDSRRGSYRAKTRSRRAPTTADFRLTSIASKLMRLQGVRSAGDAVVPRPVARAARELARTASLARATLHGDKAARDVLVGTLGGGAALAPNERLESRPLSARAQALLGMAQSGPVAGLPCVEQTSGELELMQAAFRIDAEERFHDGRTTIRAARFVRERRDQLAGFERRLNRRLGLAPSEGPDVGSMPQPDPPPDGGFEPLFPPGEEPGPDPAPDQAGLDLCLELSDVCLELFNDYARASLADSDAQLIASVVPQNLCADALTARTEFVARPDPRGVFPPRREQHRLIFRDLDITDRSVWTGHEIRFTIPADSESGFVFIRSLVNSVPAGLGRTIANLCGIPGGLSIGAGLPPSPRAMITIVRRPVIEVFAFVGTTDAVLTTEACTALTLRWSIGLEGRAANLPLPPGSSLIVELRDGTGAVLLRTSEPTGSFDHNPRDDTVYHLHAESRADSCFDGVCQCGVADAGPLEVRRVHHLHVEPREPASATIVAGRSGMLTVRISCPAPPGGTVVTLRSSDRFLLVLPDTVRVLPGETSAPVQFGTDRDRRGEVVITAQHAGHRNGELRYQVLANLTAIALSGGGAKGSFQAGALLYLREIWNEIRPTIICGTSVGSINALALAETTSSAGVDKIASIWLGLEHNDNMFVQSAPFQAASDLLGVDVTEVLFGEGDLPDFGTLLLRLLGIRSGGVGVAIGIGAILTGVAPVVLPLATNAAVNIARVIDALKTATFVYDLAPTERLVRTNVNVAAIAASGMTLRLATVALEDGALYYVTEQSRLLRGHAARSSLNEPINTTDPLIVGAMASAAIPAIFPARRIDTASTSLHHVDGGVREVVPQLAAVELGAQLIFEIAVSPLTPGPAPKPKDDDPHPSFGDPGRIFDIAFRGLDLQGNEVALGDVAPRSGFCDERERILILPRVLVHDTQQIDPGLIRINMAYGWFRAFDADQLRRNVINGIGFTIWNLWSDDLTERRARCHHLELVMIRQYLSLGGFFEHYMLETIRALKNSIAELVVERFETFGAAGFPPRLNHQILGNQGVLDWCGTWEVHRDQRADDLLDGQLPDRTFLTGIDLWSPQIIAPGVAGEDSPGYPPVQEPSVLGRFAFSQDVEQALRAR